jgi:hypothetical protein
MSVLTSQADVLAAIVRERQYQDDTRGPTTTRLHDVGAWLTLARYQMRAAEAAWSTQPSDAEALRELLQAAEIITACLEQHGVYERPQVARDLARMHNLTTGVYVVQLPDGTRLTVCGRCAETHGWPATARQKGG